MAAISDNIGGNGDAIFAEIINAHEGLDEDQSAALDARLVLLLANEVADLDRLKAVIAAAKTIA